MENSEKRAAPVKMIWMFVSLTLMIGWLLTAILGKGRIDRILENLMYNAVPIVLLAVGAEICLSRGTANLALPGIAALCGCLTALIGGEYGELVGVGLIVAIFTGAALGALTGVFAIQSRRNVWLVTGISSLLLSLLFMGLSFVFAYGYNIRVRADRTLGTVIGIAGLVIGITVAILSGLGRHVSTNEKDDAQRPGGGIRLVWTLIAGTLAGLAGACVVIRSNAYSYNMFSSYNEAEIIPALMLGGALIPNLRRSKGEGIWGGLSVVFGSIAFGAIFYFFSRVGIDANYQRVLIAAISLLLLIPNLLIGRGNSTKKAVQYPQYQDTLQYTQAPQYPQAPEIPQPPQYDQYPEYPQN